MVDVPVVDDPVVNERVGERAASPVTSVGGRGGGSGRCRRAGGGVGVEAFRRAARSANTLAAYRADWDRFCAWSAR